ncbi:ImmA/IrrE family metallo-endopeptidase [Crateriforma conspicua]|uniref:IrrE N-terminal-like domain-containing protein n=1 Tax=Crateriforma conspicua TaxID=2527996 RepID=A0A5C6FNR8_9PLAN|nr:ImmA/IrrE family metallo-endopeptidase [Crateriforma conspicua]TWU62298.1 hypothetical protein V7x_40270 [Crateriforma conspicua]
MVVDLLAQGIEVPSLSRAKIVAAADRVLRDYAAMLDQPVQAPVDLQDIATNVLKLSWGFSDLRRDYGEGVHGAIWFSQRQIWIDKSLDCDRFPELSGRMFFTLAHEIGHWVLHRHCFLDDDGNPIVFADGSDADIICRSHRRRPLIERQADEFAGCLLMPESLLRPAWRRHLGMDETLDDSTIRQRVGKLDPQRFSYTDDALGEPPCPRRVYREAFCDPLAERFAVSPEAMRIELETLGLLAG